MPRVVHFEINADNPDRAGEFYSGVFGWTITKWDGPFDYWMVMTGPDEEPGINGGITKRMDPPAATVNTIGVSSYEDYTAKILEKGGKVLTPKMAIPGYGYMGYFLDTEGNPFGIMEMDENASPHYL